MNGQDHPTSAASAVIRPAPSPASLTPVLVLVLWVFCLTVGWLGFVLPYERSKLVCLCEEPVQFEKLEVELTEPDTPPVQPPPAPNAPPPPPDALTPPPLAQPSSPLPLAAPSAPPVVAVAPSPAVAFALPVVNPTRVVQVASAASYQAASGPAQPAPPAPQQLVFGSGEGKQPKPTYPAQAVREGQEGTVVVRLMVGPDGRVTSAEAHAPSPWPLLNESALRTVRRLWRFQPGPLRAFEVAIRFELEK